MWRVIENGDKYVHEDDVAFALQQKHKRIKELESALLEADKGLEKIEDADWDIHGCEMNHTATQTREKIKPVLEEIKI
jgi:hypothetical protein